MHMRQFKGEGGAFLADAIAASAGCFEILNIFYRRCIFLSISFSPSVTFPTSCFQGR